MFLIYQFFRFIGISGIGWIIDFSLLCILHIVITNIIICNFASSLCATIFVFTFNTRNNFVQKENGLSLKIKFALYVIYQLVFITTMSILLKSISAFIFELLSAVGLNGFTTLVSKIVITPITMILNFVIMKLLIERF